MPMQSRNNPRKSHPLPWASRTKTDPTFFEGLFSIIYLVSAKRMNNLLYSSPVNDVCHTNIVARSPAMSSAVDLPEYMAALRDPCRQKSPQR
jgi:hypothetical protein